jgi:EAL domain-containing protein (putative c-di-GMP-specific phosphodiesterase class I)
MSRPEELHDYSGPRAVMPQAQIRAALHADELRMHYHLIVDLATGKASGVEALVRWQHPLGGLLYPDDFLPAVAHTPVIFEITRWALHTSLRALRAWPDWTMSINISALDATRAALVTDVEDALSANGIPAERLTLELTEQAMVQNLETAVQVLGALRKQGVGLSLDDFGTGYSSLLYLRDLPISELKIDRTFLARAQESDEDVAIVKSVAQLGRAIGVRVVAEGIETTALARCARDAGCTAGQGYLWGQPAAAEAIDPGRVLLVPELARATRKQEPSPRTRAATRIEELLGKGASLHTIAAALNSEGLKTHKNTRWTAPSVALVIARSHARPQDSGSPGQTPPG